jgi:hypothetical protein
MAFDLYATGTYSVTGLRQVLTDAGPRTRPYGNRPHAGESGCHESRCPSVRGDTNGRIRCGLVPFPMPSDARLQGCRCIIGLIA